MYDGDNDDGDNYGDILVICKKVDYIILKIRRPFRKKPHMKRPYHLMKVYQNLICIYS